MRFQVPQFIEIEDKIFGPLTIKQFIYIAGGAGLSFIVFRFLPLILVIPLVIIILGFSLGLAFYQINNKPLIYIIQSAFGYFISDKLYLWKKTDKAPEKEKAPAGENTVTGFTPSGGSQNRLHNLSWNLDLNEDPNAIVEEE